MSQRPRRAERIKQASREFKGIDVAAVRYIDEETKLALLYSINGIAKALGSVFKPFTYHEDLYLKVIGTSSLKGHVGIKSSRQIMVDAAKLQDAEEAIVSGGVDDTVHLRIDPEKPFSVDNQTDRLIVNLQDTDRNYSLDRARAFGAIQRHTMLRDTKSATPITNELPPSIAIGRVHRHVLGAQRYDFERNPAEFISDAMHDSRSLADAVAGIEVPPIAPDSFTFGALRVVALRKKPEELNPTNVSEFHQDCEFDELRLVRKKKDDDRYPLDGDVDDLIYV